jgi:hypothetical protein
MIITRTEFIKKVIRAGLFTLLAIIMLALGRKVVTGKDCSKCPGLGICKGETDCNNY